MSNLIKNQISVIITTYNRSEELLRAINSVLIQTYQNIEIIIMDNDSTDNTELIVNSLQNSKIKYYKNQTNVGVMKNKQLGLMNVTGEFAVFLDDDDYYTDKNFFDDSMRNFKLFDISYYSSSGIVRNISDNNNEESAILNCNGFISQQDAIDNYLFLHTKPLSTFTTIFKVKGFREINAIKEGYLDDGVIYLAFLLQGNGFRSNKIIGIYSMRDYKKTGNLSREFIDVNIIGTKKIFDELVDKKYNISIKWLEFHLKYVCSFYAVNKSTTLFDLIHIFFLLNNNGLSNEKVIIFPTILDFITNKVKYIYGK